MSQLKVNSIIPVSGVPTGGGGGIIQVKQSVKTDTASTTSEKPSFADTGLSVAITPTSTSSKILVYANLSFSASDGQNIAWRLVRGSTDLYMGDADGNRTRASGSVRVVSGQDADHQNCTSIFLDSPSTTSETTYKVTWCRTYPSSTIYMNKSSEDNNDDDRTRPPSSILVMEVSA